MSGKRYRERRRRVRELGEGMAGLLEHTTQADIEAALAERMGPAAYDQHTAAVRDAKGIAGAMARRRGLKKQRGAGDKPQRMASATLLIARAMEHSCPHVVAGQVPLMAYPAARVCGCAPCLLTGELLARLTVHDGDVRAGRDSHCDLCGKRTDTFSTVQISLGPALIHADLCEYCLGQMT